MPIWGLTCGYFRGLWTSWTEKSKLASMLVFWSPRGPRVPMAWGGCVGAAGYPMGCQIGRLTRHETPLARPSQATKISKPNRFAYPFRSRPRGVRGAPILNLRPHQAPSYRDTSTANLGLGVTPRRGPCSKIPSTLSSRRITHLQSLAPENAFQVGSAAVKAQPVHS